ncbi:MAG TPA: hypothetical protein VEH06_06900 [Candidatus Bathyarchaeia archaeon]|nr:hypothetical protein [Candidatus Bathyarchaeia archaeon]
MVTQHLRAMSAFAGACSSAYEGNTIVVVPRVIVTIAAATTFTKTDFEFITRVLPIAII